MANRAAQRGGKVLTVWSACTLQHKLYNAGPRASFCDTVGMTSHAIPEHLVLQLHLFVCKAVVVPL